MNAKELSAALRTVEEPIWLIENSITKGGRCEVSREISGAEIADAIDALYEKYARAVAALRKMDMVFSCDDAVHPNSIVGTKVREQLAAVLREAER